MKNMKNVTSILELIQIGNCHKYYAEKEIELFNKDPENWEDNCLCDWESVVITPETHPERLDTNGPWIERHGPSYSEIQDAYADEITVLMRHWIENGNGQTAPINDEYISLL
jgi:hypothetical protein